MREFIHRGLKINFALSLEPDLPNFSLLVKTISDLNLENVFAFPLAGWNQTEALFFTSTGNAGAALSARNGTSVIAISIDEILGNSAINFIKMDIEGAEMCALFGARKSIIRNRPHLAISIYHKPEDLWLISLEIKQFTHRIYRYYLRQYGHQLFDTILYTIPKN